MREGAKKTSPLDILHFYRAPQSVVLGRSLDTKDLMACEAQRQGTYEAHAMSLGWQEFLSAKEGTVETFTGWCVISS